MHQISAAPSSEPAARNVVEMFQDAATVHRDCSVVRSRSARWGSVKATLETIEAETEHVEIQYRGGRDRLVAVVEIVGGRFDLLQRPCTASSRHPSVCFLPGDVRATGKGVGLRRLSHLVMEFDDMPSMRLDAEASPMADERLATLCHLIAGEMEHEGSDDEYVTGLTQATSALVEKAIEGQGDGKAHCTLAPWRVRRVRAYLEEHLALNVPIQTLADVLNLSRSHFARAFKATFGMTPHRWVMVARVERSKELLLEGRLSAAEIAVETGFLDQSHFTRTFTRFTGSSPMAWRNGALY